MSRITGVRFVFQVLAVAVSGVLDILVAWTIFMFINIVTATIIVRSLLRVLLS